MQWDEVEAYIKERVNDIPGKVLCAIDRTSPNLNERTKAIVKHINKECSCIEKVRSDDEF